MQPTYGRYVTLTRVRSLIQLKIRPANVRESWILALPSGAPLGDADRWTRLRLTVSEVASN